MVEVGKFTLESLTTGMYSDPRIVYREYIQNSVDSIENAVAEGLMSNEDAYIKVFIDAENGCISIIDNGKGIDKEDIKHIFERFYKGKNSSRDSVGIGLALAKTIIEQNNGTISVESEIGKGTTFIIKYFE